MKTIRKTIDVQSPLAKPVGRVDVGRLDATGEAEIDRQMAEDDADALRDAARFARRVRRRLGFSQAEFAERIDVSLDTIRNLRAPTSRHQRTAVHFPGHPSATPLAASTAGWQQHRPVRPRLQGETRSSRDASPDPGERILPRNHGDRPRL
jgi:putative transcriptional regulator